MNDLEMCIVLVENNTQRIIAAFSLIQFIDLTRVSGKKSNL